MSALPTSSDPTVSTLLRQNGIVSCVIAFVYDFKKLLKALSNKEAAAQSEVDAFMENCAKRWQTRQGTYQLKRRRLKPDVRDSPKYPGARH